MGSGKKHRRSIQNNSNIIQQMSSNNQLNNGNDSDYGVFSDPEENADYQISATSAKNEEPSIDITIDDNDIVKEQIYNIELNDVSSSSIEQPSCVKKYSPVITSAIETKEVEIDLKLLYNEKSIDTLKYKLENDPVYSKKTTHATFFSFIILAMEIEEVCLPSIVKTQYVCNTAKLVEYIITNHSSRPEVEQFTRTMLETGVIEHIINGIIDFNSTNNIKSYKSIEHIESNTITQALQQTNLNLNESTAEDKPVNIETQPANPKPNTNRFVQFWRNLTCCCRCRKSRKTSILENIEISEDITYSKPENTSNDATIVLATNEILS